MRWDDPINVESNSAGEFHPHAFTEPDMNVSAFPVPIIQPSHTAAASEQTQDCCLRTFHLNQREARLFCPLSRLYFRVAHMASFRAMCFRIRYML